MIAYSRGVSVHDNHPRACHADTFEQFVADISSNRAANKETAGYFCGPLNGDGLRCAKGAMPRSWIAVDIDRIDADMHDDVRLWIARFLGFGWHTHSSTAAAPRLRAILSLDRDATRQECMDIGRALMHDMGVQFGQAVLVDASTFRGEQPIFDPPEGAAVAQYSGAPIAANIYLGEAAALPPEPVAPPLGAGGKVTQDRNKHLSSIAFRLAKKAGMGGEALAAALLVINAQECEPPLSEDEVRGIARGKKIVAPDEPQQPALIQPPALSDDALGLEFVERAAHLRWSHGLGWMVDDGQVWTRDTSMERYDIARRVCREAATGCDNAAEGKRVASARTVSAALTMAQGDPRIIIPPSAWDADRMALNTPGGIVDMRTGELRARAVEYVTQMARVAPVSGACPTWHKFLEAVFLGDADLIAFMQRSAGYWFTGDRREQVIHFFHGTGANGKTVLVELLLWIGGTYTLKLPASVLMQAKSERHPTELAQLRGKRLAVSSELDETSFFNEALVKELTGDDTLTARFMRGDFFEFSMTQKHVIVGNHKPRLRGGDPAMARRMLLVPFNATFKGDARDARMLERLKSEAPAILAWVVEGALMWQADGLAAPESVRSASAEYMADHDDVALWMGECCEARGEARAGDLYLSFSLWKRARGEHAPSQSVWGPRLKSRPGIGWRRSGGIIYDGIGLTMAEKARIAAASSADLEHLEHPSHLDRTRARAQYVPNGASVPSVPTAQNDPDPEPLGAEL